ncbi:17972_t:CDS:1, partial [Racocetra fulgida]
KVENIEKKVVSVDRETVNEEGKTNISELEVENLSKSLDMEEARNNRVQALEYRQKSAKENVSSK